MGYNGRKATIQEVANEWGTRQPPFADESSNASPSVEITLNQTTSPGESGIPPPVADESSYSSPTADNITSINQFSNPVTTKYVQ